MLKKKLKSAVALLCAIALCVAFPTAASAEAGGSSWYSAYAEYINAYITENYDNIDARGEWIGSDFTRRYRDGGELAYALYDFGNSGIPQLLIINTDYDAESVRIIDIYTFSGGKVVDVCLLPMLRSPFLIINEHSFIWHDSSGAGQYQYDTIYRFNDAGSPYIVYELQEEIVSWDPIETRVVKESGSKPNEPPAALDWKPLSEFSKEQALASPTASTVLVNGKDVKFDAYLINDNNYFKLRDLAYVLSGTEKQFEVSWDGENNAIALTSGRSYTPNGGEMVGKGGGVKTPTVTSSKIFLDGEEISLTAYNIEDNNYFKLREIGAAFDFEIDWDAATSTIVIDTSKRYTPD
jgi:hypothetical protein